MNSKESIRNQLQKMGMPQDRVILMHSSLRAIGKTEGNGDGLLDILKEYTTAKGGLLCIPTHTWMNLHDLSKPTLDLSDPNTCIGTLPNIAAARSDGHRSLNPTHSMVVFGNRDAAENYISGEEKLDCCSSPKGCYGRLADVNGYVLLAGVGHNRNTYLHAVETRIGVPNRLATEPAATSVRLKDGTLQACPMRQIHAEGIRDVSAFYPKLEPAFRLYGCIRDGMIGNAKTQLCSAKGMLDVMQGILSRSRGTEWMADDKPLPPELYEGFDIKEAYFDF